MELRVLGPVEIAAGGRLTTVARGRQRTILAVLLTARGRTVGTDELIARVWGPRPPASARKSLQSHVSRLRSGPLGTGDTTAVVSEPDGYRIDLATHDLDAARFEALVARARRHLEAPAQRLSLLTEALGLWRGPAFGELATHEAVRAEAVRLERLRLDAAADRVDARLALGDHVAVVGELERTVAEDPFGERAHGQLMLALYRSGRQDEALAVHRRVRDRLRDELGVDPSPPLRDLHERILRHEPGLAGPVAPSVAGPSMRGATTHPVPPVLVGRGHDLAAVVDRVEPGHLVTLTGPGGVGKTRLAERVAAEVADRFEEGTVTAALAAVRDADSVTEALVTRLGIQPTGAGATVETLVDALAQRRLLLLLDNCEHVLEVVAPLVGAILGRCPEVAVLATSRERLHLPDERLWAVAPLDVPDTGAAPEAVSATAAGELFRLRAEAVDPAFALTVDNAPDVAELCRRLDGMPLAIELAAARVRALAPADLVARLDQRFSLLAGGPRHEAGRHRTLQAVVAWSYDLLDGAEAALFDRLSVFAGTFPLDAVERICVGGAIDRDDVAGLLAELVDRSMVVTVRTEDRIGYRLLDTLREFGARRLAEVDDPRVWRRAHATYHVELAERLGPRVRGADESATVAAIHAAFDDLRAAHAWLVDDGDVAGAQRIPGALADYLFHRLRDEVTTWAQRAVAMPGAAEAASHAAALATAAYGSTSRLECERARMEATRALEHTGDDTGASVGALGALGTAALYEGRLDELLVRADEVAAAAERLDSAFHLAFARVLRVLAHAYQGDVVAADAVLPQLDDAARAAESPTMRAFARYCRGEVALDHRPAAAVDALEEAIELARRVDNALIEGVSMVSLASLTGRLGGTDRALHLFRDVIAHWRRLGDHTHQLTTLRNLVVLLARIGADEQAATLHGAVTAAATPSFGLEARRLAGAWDAVVGRLGAAVADDAARAGGELTATQASEFALHGLDRLLAS